VKAAEKYAELERAGESRPLCRCHGEAMYWSSQRNRGSAGGRWKCEVKNRERAHTVRATPEGRVADGERMAQRREAGRALVKAEIVARGNACQDCGKPYDPKMGQFHWHHREPAEKRFPVGPQLAQALPRIRSELAKCELLCARCHVHRHRYGKRKAA
jgi:hypothetical protein